MEQPGMMSSSSEWLGPLHSYPGCGRPVPWHGGDHRFPAGGCSPRAVWKAREQVTVIVLQCDSCWQH